MNVIRIRDARSLYCLCAAAVVALAMSAAPSAESETALSIKHTAIIGTELTIVGKNFGPAPVVTIGDAKAIVVSSSESEIVAATPTLEPGIYIVVVSRTEGATGDAT